jgi:tetratricopeptide (TPR) repeat protein
LRPNWFSHFFTGFLFQFHDFVSDFNFTQNLNSLSFVTKIKRIAYPKPDFMNQISYRSILVVISLLLFIVYLPGCASEPEEPEAESDRYREAVSDFYVSLAASQTDEARFAFNKMNDVAQAFPEEAAAWANLGVYAMRQGNFELSHERFQQARELQPENPDILFLSGLLESRRGNLEDAIQLFRRGTEVAPENLMIHYSLVLELEREDDIANADEIISILQEMHNIDPDNMVVIYELARVAAKERDPDLLEDAFEKLKTHSDQWPSDTIDQLNIIDEEIRNQNFSEISLELSFLRNGIEPTPAFQADLQQVQLPPSEVGYLITEFLWLPVPEFQAAEPDMEMTFSRLEDDEFPHSALFVKSVTPLEDLPPMAVFMDEAGIHYDDEVSLSYPGDIPTEGVLPGSVMAEIDYNYNFMNDVALAGNHGFRLYRQNDDYSFTDVTGSLGLPESLLNRSYRGVWSVDIDQDGDLDLVLAPENGTPVVLRNNADGTFTEIELFSETGNIIDFRWADLDADGTGDALFLTSEGELVLFQNMRAGEFVRHQGFSVDYPVSGFTISDLNADGYFDIITLSADGSLNRYDFRPELLSWDRVTLFQVDSDDQQFHPGEVGIFASDFDNNGVFDLLVSTPDKSMLWLGDSSLNYQRLEQELPGKVASVFDIDGNERLDLLGIESDGTTFRLMNVGTRNYGARSIRARASGLEGDQRINSFGIGGEMEVRSGLLYQKQMISSPIVHFGLGEYEEAEMLRIIWPNGSVQAEFAELGIGATIFNEQILKGSCPWLFTHDGEEVQFITDALWRSPLGLRINAQETAGVIQTLDRVRIPGNKLANMDGIYDVRITAELWETHFFDYVDLIAVDHPEGTEVYIDERFVFPEPDLSTRALTIPQPVARVLDDAGRDVSETVREKDGNYLKTFTKTQYQGLVNDHYIEIELGEDVPLDKPVVLVASGWLRPTDSSINLALSQGSHDPPGGLKIEVSDGNDEWNVLHEDYGVPAGKLKTILVDLEGAFSSSSDPADRRIRMHTTSEIYWDSIQWAEVLSEEHFVETSLNPVRQELRYRGYSEWYRPDSVSPKLPNYSEISGTHPRWRDLEGFHTRFGDVSELLAEIDDRYVIMNAGDEMILEFEALDEPEEGWTRTFVFVSDGWVKDGDYNTEASRTVEPLPYHGQSDYEYLRTGNLFDDPVFQRHREDWIQYHTRYVTPEPFRSALIFN